MLELNQLPDLLNKTQTGLFITKDDLDLSDLHFHRQWQMVTETKHFPIYWCSSVGTSDVNFYSHLILWKETKVFRVKFFNFSYICSIPYWKSRTVYLKDKYIYIFQLNKLAQNLRLAAFIFVALVWRSYWCFSLTHLSLTYHTAMEDWAKLAATRHTSSPHTGALPEQQAAREVRRQNPTC